MRYFVTVEGREHEVVVENDRVLVDGEPVTLDLVTLEGSETASALVDGRSLRVVPAMEAAGRWLINIDGLPMTAAVVDERTRRIQEMATARGAASGPQPIRAPMPGLVVKVEVVPGDEVAKGQGIVIVEAMKMENELKSLSAGVVSTVLVKPGEAVEKDQILVELEPGPEESK